MQGGGRLARKVSISVYGIVGKTAKNNVKILWLSSIQLRCVYAYFRLGVNCLCLIELLVPEN